MNIWKPVVGYEGRYEVSSEGMIRGPGGHTTSGSTGTGGYKQACLREKGAKTGITRNIHVIVAAVFLGPRPEGLHVCHRDGDKTNNNLDNLRYDTPKKNWEDFREVPTGTHAITRLECPRGHQLDHPNLMKSQLDRGWRSCLACSRAAGYTQQHPELKFKQDILADEYYQRIMETK